MTVSFGSIIGQSSVEEAGRTTGNGELPLLEFKRASKAQRAPPACSLKQPKSGNDAQHLRVSVAYWEDTPPRKAFSVQPKTVGWEHVLLRASCPVQPPTSDGIGAPLHRNTQ